MLCDKNWHHIMIDKIQVDGDLKFIDIEFWLKHKKENKIVSFFKKLFNKKKDTINSNLEINDILSGIILIDKSKGGFEKYLPSESVKVSNNGKI